MAERQESERGSGRLVTIAEEGEQMWEEIVRLVQTARRTGRDGQEALREAVEGHPYATLAAAATTGYLLGGGLPNWALRWLVDVAGRVTWMAVVQHVIDAAKADPGQQPADTAGFQA